MCHGNHSCMVLTFCTPFRLRGFRHARCGLCCRCRLCVFEALLFRYPEFSIDAQRARDGATVMHLVTDLVQQWALANPNPPTESIVGRMQRHLLKFNPSFEILDCQGCRWDGTKPGEAPLVPPNPIVPLRQGSPARGMIY